MISPPQTLGGERARKQGKNETKKECDMSPRSASTPHAWQEGFESPLAQTGNVKQRWHIESWLANGPRDIERDTKHETTKAVATGIHEGDGPP